MRATQMLVFVAMLVQSTTGPAAAQGARTGVGGGALSARKAAHTTAKGQTKPPGRDPGPASRAPLDRSPPGEVADDAVGRRICVGCFPDRATTGSLPVGPAVAGGPGKPDAALDELHAGPAPERQMDLDTVALASATRERAASMEEKTSGLWRSWLVSVCDGCGNQKRAEALRAEDWPVRDKSMATGSINRDRSPGDAPPGVVGRETDRRQRDFNSDLSTENIDTIRRMRRW